MCAIARRNAALREPATADPQAIVLEFPLAGWTVPALWEQVQHLAPGVPVLVRDPQATLQDAVRMARLGVYQFLTENEDPFGLIEQAIESRRTGNLARLAVQVAARSGSELLLGDSPEMRQVKHIIRMVGNRRATVLITGETGTGKEMAALAIHRAAARRKGSMVAVNCSALPENLLEAELFGHVRGAFTGAVQNRTGRFEQAQGGTLFLDEIGELPMDLQVKLLRVLQEREYQRLGSSETIKADIRVIAATNCDLTRKIEQGAFREDLYYRLNVVPIQMPPLRQRPEDIPALAAHFVEKICALEEMDRKDASRRRSVERLCGYFWPGNVRQLENAVEMAIALSGERRTLMLQDFPLPAPSRARVRSAGGLAGGLRTRWRPGLRADARRDRTQHSRTGAPQNQREQESRRRDAAAQTHHALGQGAQPGLSGGVQLSLTTSIPSRSAACRSRPARARRVSSSATRERVARSGI